MTKTILALLLALSASSAAFAQSPDYIPWHWDEVATQNAVVNNAIADENDEEVGELGW
jgi:hypothetical protein